MAARTIWLTSLPRPSTLYSSLRILCSANFVCYSTVACVMEERAHPTARTLLTRDGWNTGGCLGHPRLCLVQGEPASSLSSHDATSPSLASAASTPPLLPFLQHGAPAFCACSSVSSEKLWRVNFHPHTVCHAKEGVQSEAVALLCSLPPEFAKL